MCFICQLVVLLAWSLNIFEIFLILKIQQVASLNSTNCVPMWLLVASLGPWLKFLGLVGFWIWLSFLVAFIQLQWERLVCKVLCL
jgi:hypothetical protein